MTRMVRTPILIATIVFAALLGIAYGSYARTPVTLPAAHLPVAQMTPLPTISPSPSATPTLIPPVTPVPNKP